MSLLRTLFPQESRSFPGKRWLNISLRTLHLIGVAGLGGAYLYAAPRELWAPYLWLSLGSGVALVATSLYSNGIWLLQLRGLLILFKLALLGVMLWLPGFSLQLGVTVIVLSSVIAHAPGNVRYYSIWHRRRIENL
jgi:hypothetical protein